MEPTPPRRLPLRVVPLTGETLDGYLRRLARHNGTPYSPLRIMVRDHPVPAAALSGLTGLTPTNLCRALPELCTADEPVVGGEGHRPARWRSPACTHCAAARGADTTTTVFACAERAVCRKHQRWIGGPHLPCTANQQFSCAAAPALTAAATRHHRLAGIWGTPLTRDAFDDALVVFNYWRKNGILFGSTDPGLRTRRASLGWVADTYIPEPIIDACCYPGTVTLTGVILRLRARIAHGADTRTSVNNAHAEIARTVLIGARPGGAGDPLHYLTSSLLWPSPQTTSHHDEIANSATEHST
ncbi:TniQ family protein [Nocardia sp. NPDC127606]|uniref:TniQ family protein n=1 Tax=Nocardia sp. NPDC127606 TaxID=3345406 RepID=UPI00362F267D